MTLFKKCYDFQDADMVKAVGLYPLFRPMEGSLGAQVLYNGKCVVMIGSNNYLGLTHDSRIKQAAKEAVDRFGSGFTGSRALNGTSVMHNELETAFADYLEKESTLVMTTGFITNLGSISCLVEEGEYILSDSENSMPHSLHLVSSMTFSLLKNLIKAIFNMRLKTFIKNEILL